jgi:hypothetical protein
MTEQEFRAVYPLIADWVQRTLAEHAKVAQLVASLGFTRLPRYYDEKLLVSTKVVVVPRVPVPPLSAMGLARFSEFERMEMAGITYFDTYFVRADQAHLESLHFHELVHVIQWRLLGPEKFLAFYADGLERFGYRKSRLEVMAYRLQGRFERETQPFGVEAACQSLIALSNGAARGLPRPAGAPARDGSGGCGGKPVAGGQPVGARPRGPRPVYRRPRGESAGRHEGICREPGQSAKAACRWVSREKSKLGCESQSEPG